MSGVGITGKIKPKDGGSFPVFEDIDGQGGYRTVADIAARDAIPADYRSILMAVALQDTGLTYQLVGGITNADWRLGGGATQPFAGAYYVNSAFNGIQTGSQSNPFTTTAAAFAFAASVGVIDGVVYLGQNHTENVVFPTIGNWELAGTNQSATFAIVLTGTVDLSSTASRRCALTNMEITGAISGHTSGNSTRVRFLNASVSSTVTLTASGAGVWRASFSGLYQPGVLSIGGGVDGLVTVAGMVSGLLVSFLGGITLTGAPENNEFDGCSFVGPITTSVTGHVIRMLNKCEWNAGQLFVSTGTTTLQLDGASWANLALATPTFTGTWSVAQLNGNRGTRVTATDNLGLQFLTTILVPGQMTITATLTLLVAGILGTAVVNVTYVDLTGVLRTKPLGAGLNIAGTPGDEFAASLTFVTNGTSGIDVTVTGIVTPGSLSYSMAANLKAEY